MPLLPHGTERFPHVEVDGPIRRNVVFRWCAGCRRWVRLAGIEGRMNWIVMHRDHRPADAAHHARASQ